MNLDRAEIYAVSGALVVGVIVLWKAGKIAADVAGSAVDAAKGAVTGDNALTRNATDASGAPVTAYVGVPVLGTLGAGANALTGGWAATIGNWLGGTAYDFTHPDPDMKNLGQGYNTNGEFDPLNVGVFGYGA